MSHDQPTIFVSAVTQELKTARQLVIEKLEFLGYRILCQELFGMEAGDLRLMISKKIDASEGVIQLIGNRFGFGPNQPDPRFGRISYTQYEAKYATERNLKVWYILLTDQFPFDAAPAEAAELRELQKAYRKGIEQSESLWYPASSMPEMEAKVLHLRSDLAACRTYSYSIKNLGIQISAPISAGKTWLL